MENLPSPLLQSTEHTRGWIFYLIMEGEAELSTPKSTRKKNLTEELLSFPYLTAYSITEKPKRSKEMVHFGYDARRVNRKL